MKNEREEIIQRLKEYAQLSGSGGCGHCQSALHWAKEGNTSYATAAVAEMVIIVASSTTVADAVVAV